MALDLLIWNFALTAKENLSTSPLPPKQQSYILISSCQNAGHLYHPETKGERCHHPETEGEGCHHQNACDECKRRKARCNGQNPCARCLTHENLTCHYTPSVRASKDALRAEIMMLQRQQTHSDRILHSLASGVQPDAILQQLQDGETLENISQRLLTRQSGSADASTNTNSPTKSISLSSKSLETDLQSFADSHRSSMQPAESSRRIQDECIRHEVFHSEQAWTTVTIDFKLVEHLVVLYFCWEYPTFSSLSKEHFMKDFETGQHRYCTPLLVNIMCALGCRFSDRPLVTETSPTGQTLGNRFYDEAYMLWEKERFDPSLTTIQATGLMSLWKSSRGKNDWSSFYSEQAIIMAIEMGLHLQTDGGEPSEAEDEVRSVTFWGAFVLDQAWSLASGRSPYLSGQTLNYGPWSLARITPYGYLTPTKEYSQKIPHRNRAINSPTSIASIYYHFAVLLLFGPFINLRFLGPDLVAKEICMDAATAIGSILSTYRQLYGLRRTPSFVPYISLASSIVRLVTTIAGSADPLKSVQGMFDLQEMIPCHESALSSIKILQHMESLLGTEEGKIKRELVASPNLLIKSPMPFFDPEMRKITSSPFHLMQECSIFSPFPNQLSAFAEPEELRLNGFEKDLIALSIN
ncbi:fungal-specific transcription factor domain-containing protein [Xylogone sp. PMI_703]|nr:fungal-specific transcription factor domain-containing protein [Xylogone sp. PMI_703]